MCGECESVTRRMEAASALLDACILSVLATTLQSTFTIDPNNPPDLAVLVGKLDKVPGGRQ